MAFQQYIVDGNGTLLIPAIKSDNNLWSIDKDGTAHFAHLDVQSTDLTLTGGSLTNIGSATFDPIDLVYWELGNLAFFNFRGVATAAGSGASNVGLLLPFTLVNTNSAGRQLTQLGLFSYTNFTGASGVAALPFGTGGGIVLSAAGGLTQFRTEDGAFLRGGHIIIGSQLIVHGFGVTV